MTQEEKQKQFKPHSWNLYENGRYIDTLPSHAAAKRAKYFKTKEAYDDMLDLTYTIKRVDQNMITEDYVSFETAKLLKEKGFDEKCRIS